jgi:hypothetical protein
VIWKDFGLSRPARSIAAGLFIAMCIVRPLSGVAAIPVLTWVNDSTDTNRWNVEVSRLSPSSLETLRRANWTRAQWEQILTVRVVQDDLLGDIGLPPMLGTYSVDDRVVRFLPQFPVQRGLKYRATFFPAKLNDLKTSGQILTANFQLGKPTTNATTVVKQVYPTSDTLPENLLKFYVHFSAPMRRGHIYDYIHLRNAAGRDVQLPFLEIDEELWNPDMTRLTLFIDPGRIKRGVQPLEEIGPALEQGKSFTLVIDREWPDANGALLKESFRKTFQVGPPDRTSIDTAAWKIQAPKTGSHAPLAVRFSKPMDHALAQRVIRVADKSNRLLEGSIALEDHEQHWTFVPKEAWRPGPHALLVEKTIEDLAGNNIGKAFEVDLFEGVQRRFTNETVRLPFEIR